jgi:hypothetical protein
MPQHDPACSQTRPRILQPVRMRIFLVTPVLILAFSTCRIDTIEKNGMEYLKGLGIQNTKDLCKLIEVSSLVLDEIAL